MYEILKHTYTLIKYIIGTYNISIDQLCNPNPLLRVRDVKEWCVEYLAEEFKKENNGHEEMTAPLVVPANVTKELQKI